MNHDFVIIDFETNHTIFPGLDAVECGLLHCSFDKFKILFHYNERFKPRSRIQKTVSRITGIYPGDLQSKPYFADYFRDFFHRYLENNLLVGHNVCFDLKILGYYYTRVYRKNFTVRYLDTLPLARKYLPGMPNYKLGTIARSIHRYFDLPGHRAINDCLMCHHILSTIYSQENSLKFIRSNIRTYHYKIPPDIENIIPFILKKASQFFSLPISEDALTLHNGNVYLELVTPSGKSLKTYQVENYYSDRIQFRLLKRLRLFASK